MEFFKKLFGGYRIVHTTYRTSYDTLSNEIEYYKNEYSKIQYKCIDIKYKHSTYKSKEYLNDDVIPTYITHECTKAILYFKKSEENGK